jgi:hypothetical protein
MARKVSIADLTDGATETEYNISELKSTAQPQMARSKGFSKPWMKS